MNDVKTIWPYQLEGYEEHIATIYYENRREKKVGGSDDFENLRM